MKYDFAVIGANGMQGKIVARDLLEGGYSVLLAANDRMFIDETLKKYPGKADFVLIDLRDIESTAKALAGTTDILINCAIDDFNLKVTKMALELNMHYLDLGGEIPMHQETEKLDPEFRKKNLIAISGAGSTPGINNVMVAYLKDRFDTIETAHLGFVWDSNIKVFLPPFSMDAITYEFAEPATVFLDGKYVEKLPTEPTGINHDYREIGKQDVWYVKHVEQWTIAQFLRDKGVKNVVEYGGFPPHSYSVIKMLLNNGFLSKTPVIVDGKEIRPIDLTIEVLRRIPIPAGYKETEDLWVKVYGKKDGQTRIEEMDCIARTIPGWEDATCNIDTSFPISIMAQMVKNGEIKGSGFHAPETIVPPLPFFKHLGEHQLEVYDNGKRIN
ncbi:MAG TPA: saccharopine dehydrogenase C-terminal domain-containing protein [Candidatus Paceibacterota bacterium]|nr:saccharopine dehydrogenase C-terminal domain-containing protein [Candidatus Paceibacterota bacterium]